MAAALAILFDATYHAPHDRTPVLLRASLAAGEPLAGTADRVDVWLLLEYNPTWRAKAVTDNDLSPKIKAWLDAQMAAVTGRGLKPRLQFIRRPELDRAEITLSSPRRTASTRAESTGYDAVAELDIQASLGTQSMPRVEAQQYFVCTNGQRDLCCARFGRPTYMRLREVVGDRAWQTTHLGGHRFAPNVLTLPQGVLYGRVTPQDVSGFVADVEAGRLARDFVRGRSVLSAEAQAAELALDEEMLELVAAKPASGHADRERRTSHTGRPSRRDGYPRQCGDEAPKCVRPIRAALD